MKKHDWYRSLSLADDKYIAEAHPQNAMIRETPPPPQSLTGSQYL